MQVVALEFPLAVRRAELAEQLLKPVQRIEIAGNGDYAFGGNLHVNVVCRQLVGSGGRRSIRWIRFRGHGLVRGGIRLGWRRRVSVQRHRRHSGGGGFFSGGLRGVFSGGLSGGRLADEIKPQWRVFQFRHIATAGARSGLGPGRSRHGPGSRTAALAGLHGRAATLGRTSGLLAVRGGLNPVYADVDRRVLKVESANGPL